MEKDKLVKGEFELIKNKINSYLEDVKNKDNQTISQDDINLISIIGDRGFGKTTILEKIGNPDCGENNIKEILYLETIKPLYVANSQKSDFGILEMIMANIVNYVNNDDDINQHDRDRLYNLIQKKMSIVLNKGISDLDRLDSSITLLETIYEQTKIDKEIAGVIDKLLEIYGKKLLVIKVDDLDLFENSVLRNIVDDISKFLVNSQVVIIVAYNEENIMHKYLNELIHDNSEVYKSRLMPETTLISRARNELNKIFTESNKVYLPRMGQVYQMNATNIFKDVEKNSDKTILEFCKDKFLELCPVNTIAYNSFETPNIYLPNSIRELKQFEEKIKELETVKTEQTDNFSEKFASWFTEMTINKLENYKYVTMIKELEKAEDKPPFIVKKLREFASEMIPDYETLNIFNDSIRDYDNIALGDLIQILNEYYDYDQSQEGINLIYAIKLLLSIELHSLLNKYKESREMANFKEYQKIAKGYPTPIDRKYYDVNWNPEICFKDIMNPEIYFHEKVILVRNIFSPNAKGPVLYHNSTFLDVSISRINEKESSNIHKSRREKRVKLYDFSEVEKATNESFISYFQEIQSASNTVRDTTLFISNPFTFLLSKAYIDWALNENQLVIFDMFFLDFLYDLKTHRSSEKRPLKRVYLRLDEEVTSGTTKVYDINKKIISKSVTGLWWEQQITMEQEAIKELNIPEFPFLLKDIQGENLKEISITRQNEVLKALKIKLALYTRYNKDIKVKMIRDMSFEQIDRYINFLNKWEQPTTIYTNPNNPTTIHTEITKNKILSDMKIKREFYKGFKDKFGYDLNDFEKEQQYYSGTEVGSMRNFTRNYGKK